MQMSMSPFNSEYSHQSLEEEYAQVMAMSGSGLGSNTVQIPNYMNPASQTAIQINNNSKCAVTDDFVIPGKP